jgi:peptidoglycan/LPS O-acetylase OafA/YrhL
MYEGWYLVVAVAVAVVLAQLVLAPASVVPTLLSARPIVALGRISYSLYLWHWPLLLVITEERTGLTGLSLLAARLTASLAAGGLSYAALERRSAVKIGRRKRPTRSWSPASPIHAPTSRVWSSPPPGSTSTARSGTGWR